MGLVCGLVLIASQLRWWPVTILEAWGFATGGVCVWLVVRQHIWNWPVGLANNALFLVLFLRSRLFADMALQAVYFGLGVYGWWMWRRGGPRGSAIATTRASRAEWTWLAAVAAPAVWGIRSLLLAAHGAAPLWDAVTAVLSLEAQYLLSRKRLESWWLWIAADVIYVPLYLSRDLPLTALLYGVFLLMCLAGVRTWLGVWRTERATA
jgi:nicotinamide mononucleotide transporter